MEASGHHPSPPWFISDHPPSAAALQVSFQSWLKHSKTKKNPGRRPFVVLSKGGVGNPPTPSPSASEPKMSHVCTGYIGRRMHVEMCASCMMTCCTSIMKFYRGVGVRGSENRAIGERQRKKGKTMLSQI